MAQQNLQPKSGVTPLKVQRSFQRLDTGRGSKAAALSEALGFALEAAPKIAEIESKEAFEAGMKARIDGVKKENAGAANNSVLGFMFSKRASDGFDYQDAQLELPTLQSEELLMMDKLRNSRNPNDFREYIKGRDEALQERLSSKSDIYRYTVADSMLKTREQQAKVFTNWVQSNREKDRRAAAAAAARAAAQRKALNREAVARDALGNIQDGAMDDQEFGDYVQNAQDKYGVSASEAKGLYIESLILQADHSNDESILEGIPLEFLDRKQRGTLNTALDTIRGERISREDRIYTMQQRDAKVAEKAEKQELVNGLRNVLLSGGSGAELTATALDTPLGKADPKAAIALAETFSGVHDATIDLASEASLLNQLEEEAERSAITGDWDAYDDLIDGVIATKSVRSSKFDDLYALREDAQNMADTLVQDNLRSVYGQLEADFQPSFVRAGEMTPVAKAIEDMDNIKTYHRSIFEGAKKTARSLFKHEIKRHMDIHNIDVRNIQPEALDKMADRVYAKTVRMTNDLVKLKADVKGTLGFTDSDEQGADVDGDTSTVITPKESLSSLMDYLK